MSLLLADDDDNDDNDDSGGAMMIMIGLYVIVAESGTKSCYLFVYTMVGKSLTGELYLAWISLSLVWNALVAWVLSNKLSIE
jgi:hypothetical protein